MKGYMLAAIGIATMCSVVFAVERTAEHLQSIDAIIGQGGFNKVFPVTLSSRTDMQNQITRRLEYLEPLLRSRDVSAWPAELQAERAHNLDRLHEYRVRGEYTTNYDYPNKPLPCFIDRDGHYCAVAYLIAQSVGTETAQTLNSHYQYATIAQMDSPVLDWWIENSGLTRAEVETIQVVEIGEDGGGNSIRGGRPVIVYRIDSASVSYPPIATTGADSTQSPTLSLDTARN